MVCRRPPRHRPRKSLTERRRIQNDRPSKHCLEHFNYRGKSTERRQVLMLRGISRSKILKRRRHCFAQRLAGTRNGRASPPVIVLNFGLECKPHMSLLSLVSQVYTACLVHDVEDRKRLYETLNTHPRALLCFWPREHSESRSLVPAYLWRVTLREEATD